MLFSGVVPQIAVIGGPCAGGAAYSPALMDFIIMTRKNAHMFISGPEVIKAVTGKAVTMDEVGGADMHAAVTGNVHFVAEDDAAAIDIVKQASLLPAVQQPQDPPHRPTQELALAEDERISELDPRRSPERRWTSAPSSSASSIAGEFLEVHR